MDFVQDNRLLLCGKGVGRWRMAIERLQPVVLPALLTYDGDLFWRLSLPLEGFILAVQSALPVLGIAALP